MTRGDLLAKIDAIRKRATAAQQRAADPGRSVWVSANAGTGKTRVLTNRILRLLVDGAQVADILAVTYTRMAAQEMRNRVFDTLSRWAVSNGSDLENSLRETGLDKPTEKQKQRARQLFAMLLDQPVSLRIETIHAFSQSVLRRFPVEAGIQPNFELATEAQITQLQQETATQLLASTDPLVQAAVKAVAHSISTRISSSTMSGISANIRSCCSGCGIIPGQLRKHCLTPSNTLMRQMIPMQPASS